MAVKRFEELIVWQKAQDLSVAIYMQFRDNKDFSFRDQIKRASVSISNNIAEGFDRNSNAEFKRFLYFSLASNSEVRSMLHLSIRLDFVEEKLALKLINDTDEISKMIRGLIKSLKV